MELLKGVLKKSVIIVLPAAVASAIYMNQSKVPLGILSGWLFGMFNLRQLSRNVQGLVGSEKASLKLVFLSMTRLLTLFIAIIFLVYYRVVDVFGLLFGFTVVFILIMFEGARTAGKK